MASSTLARYSLRVFSFLAYVFAYPMAAIFALMGSDKLEPLLMKVFRYRDISKDVDGVPTLYLRRFFLTPRSWPVRVFLHHIARSDDDRERHTHPWDFSTTILKGAYIEDLPDAPRLLHTGCSVFNKAEHLHRVEILDPVWSLVLCERAKQVWGFQTAQGWVDWRTYLGEPDSADSPEDVVKGAA